MNDDVPQNDQPCGLVESTEEVITTYPMKQEQEYEDEHVIVDAGSTDPDEPIYLTVPGIGFVYLRPVKDVPRDAVEHRVKMSEIDNTLYNLYCADTMRGPIECSEEQRDTLVRMASSGDYAVAVNVLDTYLGEIPELIVHIPSAKFFLSPQMRQFCIQQVVSDVKRHKNPIATALQTIQKHYVGYPSVIQLRAHLLAELQRQLPNAVSLEQRGDIAVSSKIAGKDLRGRYGRRQSKSDKYIVKAQPVEVSQVVIGAEQDRESGVVDIFYLGRIDIQQPIDDGIYDIIAEVLHGVRTLESIADSSTRATVAEACRGSLLAEHWPVAKNHCPAGWRIIHRHNRKMIPRSSETDQIMRSCFSSLSGSHSQADVLSYIESQFVGLTNRNNVREAALHSVLRGSRVQFPMAPPQNIASKPMQYIQIDVVAMAEATYGSRFFSEALLVTDIHSKFVFGRALADVSDSPDRMFAARHLIDIFGTFGPPEAFRSFCFHPTLTTMIVEVMASVEQMFKVRIKNMGIASSCTSDLSKSIYDRAMEQLGDRERWVEALPLAVTEWNQQPVSREGRNISPFELMFGRRPWRNDAVPPWVGGPTVNASNNYQDNNEPQFTPGPSRSSSDESSCSSGSGALFAVGDRVFVRNRIFDVTLARKDRSSRYFRGVVEEVDASSRDLPYRIIYWVDDSSTVDEMESDVWPAQDDGFELVDSWFSPWDVTASTPYLAKLRSAIVRQSSSIEPETSCEKPPIIGRRKYKTLRYFNENPMSTDEFSTMKKRWTEDPLGGNLSMISIDRKRKLAATDPTPTEEPAVVTEETVPKESSAHVKMEPEEGLPEVQLDPVQDVVWRQQPMSFPAPVRTRPAVLRHYRPPAAPQSRAPQAVRFIDAPPHRNLQQYYERATEPGIVVTRAHWSGSQRGSNTRLVPRGEQ